MCHSCRMSVGCFYIDQIFHYFSPPTSLYKVHIFSFLSFSFLEKEYSRHCVPSNVSSGLSNRPLSYVYVDGVATKPTTKKLPTGEKLNGTITYASIMSYFSTTDITPQEVYDKGWEILKKIYPQVLAGVGTGMLY